MKFHQPNILACTLIIISFLSGCRAKPAQIIPTLTAAINHTCALNSDGRVKCWGGNQYGQLGDGTTTQRLAPVEVVGLTSKVIAISAGGYHTCALTSEGKVQCWGYNHFGQLGDGTMIQQSKPVDVIGLTNRIVSIATGNNHTCVLTSKGGVQCWGDNQAGALGNGKHEFGGQLTPVEVIGLTSGVHAINAADDVTCALIEGGGAKCWGDGFFGKLGNGTTTFSYTPVDVSGLTNVTAISGGDYHVCALTSEGRVKCWGSNTFGGISNHEIDTSLLDPNFLLDVTYPTPVDVSGLPGGMRAIATGGRHSCAVTSDRKVKCWGCNDSGQLGNGVFIPMPSCTTNAVVDVIDITGDVMAITAGGSHTCVLVQDGAIQCWGSNGAGQLGNGTTESQWRPVNVIAR